MMDELGNRVARQSLDGRGRAALSPTSSRESMTRQYRYGFVRVACHSSNRKIILTTSDLLARLFDTFRVYQNGAVADRVLARSRSRQSTTSSNNNMLLDLDDDVQYGVDRRPRGHRPL